MALDTLLGSTYLPFFLASLEREDGLEIRGFVQHVTPYVDSLEVLVSGKGDRHYEDRLLFGLLNELKGNRQKANFYYNDSLQSINSDPNLNRSDKIWSDLTDSLNSAIIRTGA